MSDATRPAGGVLSVVGTPIGNLADASPRVVETLRAADVILCEDTRVTGKLLAHFGVHTPLTRADDNVLASRIAPTLERVAEGERVAFVSDAGMPGVSDPGQRLVDAALDQGLRVEVIPGPSAVTCALVASGLPMDHFFFEGFLPRKASAMEARLAEGVASGRIRSGIPSVTLFRLIVGPVRMLFKQWGMSGMKFDLRAESGRLLDALELLLKP